MSLALLEQIAGQPAPGALSPLQLRMRDQAMALVRDEELLRAADHFNLLPLDGIEGEELLIGAERLRAPLLLPPADQGELTAVTCGVCTLGPWLEHKVGELFEKKQRSLGLALDSFGNELLLALGRRLQDRIFAACRERGLSVGRELRAGDPGLDLAAQAGVLRLAQAERIGIRLHGGHLLNPLKSASVVFAVGRDLPQSARSVCADCPSRARCTLTTSTFEAA